MRNKYAAVIIGKVALAFAIASVFSPMLQSQTGSLEHSTAIPVSFTSSLVAGKAHVGDTVTAKTMQTVALADGRILPQGTQVVGHVVASNRFVAETVPYATQAPSTLAIQLDSMTIAGSPVPVSVSVRAISNAVDSHEASVPQYQSDVDTIGTRILIGGDQFVPTHGEVMGRNGDVVGYNRKDGVFARLKAGESVSRFATLECDASNTEQSMGIFSADACGLYGFTEVYLADNGSEDRLISLQSRNRDVTLYAGSAALLEVR